MTPIQIPAHPDSGREYFKVMQPQIQRWQRMFIDWDVEASVRAMALSWADSDVPLPMTATKCWRRIEDELKALATR